MTATSEEVDFTLLEAHDFDLACEINKNREDACDSPAEWAVTLSCCGRIVFMCDPHFQTVVKWVGTAVFADSTKEGCGREDIDQPIANAERLDRSGKA